MVCSICKTPGHNKRSCSRTEKKALEDLEHREEKSDELPDCPICMEPITEKNSAITDCNHRFCLSCLLKSLKQNNACPLCRAKIEDKIKKEQNHFTANMASTLIEEAFEVVNTREAVFTATNSGNPLRVISVLMEQFGTELSYSIAEYYASQSNSEIHDSWQNYVSDSDEEEEEEAEAEASHISVDHQHEVALPNVSTAQSPSEIHAQIIAAYQESHREL